MQDTKQARVLTLAQAIAHRMTDQELEALEAANLSPRILLYERALNSDMLNERFIQNAPPGRKIFYDRIPIQIAQILEAYIVHRRYDAVVSWAENLGLPFAALLKATGRRIPHVGIFSWISKPKKARLLKRVHSHFDKILLMSSVQRDFAVDVLGIPPSKIEFDRWPVDLTFWNGSDGIEPTMICSVGREMRDFGTMVKSLRGLEIPCHIAASVALGKKDAWQTDIERAGPLPPGVTIGKKSYVELRDLYTRSRFLVMPLLPTDTDNGTTSILEAMAMGKPVICSRVKGQADVIQEGKTGFFVPAGDEVALREKIKVLWDNPGLVERMGKEARKYVEQYHSLDRFVAKVKATVDEAVARHRASNRK
jgi:glycosyltransferase involved in cell wall biosynthesis